MVRYKEKLANMQRKTFSRNPGELLLTSSSKKMTKNLLRKTKYKDGGVAPDFHMVLYIFLFLISSRCMIQTSK